MSLSHEADYAEIQQLIHQWLSEHYPDVICPGDRVMDQKALLNYYEHCEVAILEMDLIDEYSEKEMVISVK